MFRKIVLTAAAATVMAVGLGMSGASAAPYGVNPGFHRGPFPPVHRVCQPEFRRKWVKDRRGHWHLRRVYVGTVCHWVPWRR